MSDLVYREFGSLMGYILKHLGDQLLLGHIATCWSNIKHDSWETQRCLVPFQWLSWTHQLLINTFPSLCSNIQVHLESLGSHDLEPFASSPWNHLQHHEHASISTSKLQDGNMTLHDFSQSLSPVRNPISHSCDFPYSNRLDLFQCRLTCHLEGVLQLWRTYAVPHGIALSYGTWALGGTLAKWRCHSIGEPYQRRQLLSSSFLLLLHENDQVCFAYSQPLPRMPSP